MTLTVAIEQDDDGRWSAAGLELPGVLTYGQSPEAAPAQVPALALRVVADRLDQGEAGPDLGRLAQHGREAGLGGSAACGRAHHTARWRPSRPLSPRMAGRRRPRRGRARPAPARPERQASRAAPPHLGALALPPSPPHPRMHRPGRPRRSIPAGDPQRYLPSCGLTAAGAGASTGRSRFGRAIGPAGSATSPLAGGPLGA
jgi:predicted RNase H-like HicB family nuclease